MKTKIELEQGIIKFTTKIQTEFPELSKYIIEIPNNNSENEEKSLADYYSSLKNILYEYAKTHEGLKDKKNNESTVYSDLQIYPSSEDI